MSGDDFPERIFAASIVVHGREQDEMFYTEHAVDVKGLPYQVYVPTPHSDKEKREGAAFRGLGQTIRAIRERRGMDMRELAAKCKVTLAELKKIERGDFDELWRGLRLFGLVANAFDIPLDALIVEAVEPAAGPGGRQRQESMGQAESRKPVPKGRFRIFREKKVLPRGWR